MAQRIYSGTHSFDFILHCRCLCSASLLSIYDITSGTQHNHTYLYLFPTFPFRSRNHFYFSLIHIFLPFSFLFSSFLINSDNHRTSFYKRSGVESPVWSLPCIFGPLLWRQSKRWVFVRTSTSASSIRGNSWSGSRLQHHSSKDICVHDKFKDKRTFEAFEGDDLCKLLWSKSARDRHGKSLSCTATISRCCNLDRKTPLQRKVFSILFRAGQRSEALTNRGQFLQTVLNSACRSAVATLHIKTSSVFEVHMLFHSFAILEEAIQAMTLECSNEYSKESFFDILCRSSRRRGRIL